MKNNIKIVIAFIIGLIVAGTIVYASNGLTTRNISYGNDTLKEALDDLYKKYDLNNIEAKKVCQYQSEGSYGAKGTVGAKYKCQLGANDKDENGVIYRYFYILAVNNDNTVDLIMDRNINNNSMSWINAMKYFSKNDEGTSYKNKWTNILDVDLPRIQSIVDAIDYDWRAAENNVGKLCLGNHTASCDLSTNSNYAWLFNYTKGCLANGCTNDGNDAPGYYTRDMISNTSIQAWVVYFEGAIGRSNYSENSQGVRPVITLLKSNLYE